MSVSELVWKKKVGPTGRATSSIYQLQTIPYLLHVSLKKITFVT